MTVLRATSGEGDVPANSPQTPSAGKRLHAVYRRLLATVTDEDGYGGPVAHIAEAHGWSLRIATSDFGDLLVSARKDERVVGFECLPDATWGAVYRGTKPDDIEWLADYAEAADWQDTIDRRRAS